MKKTLWIAVQIIWAALCVLALIEARQGYRGASDWQMDEGLAFEMMFLSFPSSRIVPAGLILTGVVLKWFHLGLQPSSKPEMTATWLLFLIAGYAQWSFSCRGF